MSETSYVKGTLMKLSFQWQNSLNFTLPQKSSNLSIVESLWFVSALNSHCSISKFLSNSPRISEILALWRIPSFHNNTLLPLLNPNQSISYFHMLSCDQSGTVLVYNFFPASSERDIKQNVPSKNCCTWCGFKCYMVGRAKCLCHFD